MGLVSSVLSYVASALSSIVVGVPSDRWSRPIDPGCKGEDVPQESGSQDERGPGRLEVQARHTDGVISTVSEVESGRHLRFDRDRGYSFCRIRSWSRRLRVRPMVLRRDRMFMPFPCLKGLGRRLN